MYSSRLSGLKREMFGYVDGWYDLVLRKLQEKLDEVGVETRFGARVTGIEDRKNAVSVSLGSGEALQFDKVVTTIPTGAIAALCPQLKAEEKARLNSVEYQGIVCASVLLKKPLGPYYVTNITDRWVPFTGVIEMTTLVDRERFGGNSLVYLPCYLTQKDPYWNKTDADIEAEFVAALERMYPEFKRSDVIAFKVFRARQVLAISTLDYSSKALPAVATSLPNVFVLNSAQIANGTLNVNETLGVVNSNFDQLKNLLSAAA
ncbi:MAG: FAD-dependent oxidoreductase [Steroidobacteraceae bacterium]